MTMLKMTPSQTRAGIISCFQAGLVPFVTSSPGLGKSSLYASVAHEFGLELIDLRLSQCAPEDLMGLPMRIGEGRNMKAAFAPFEMFPTENTPLPSGKEGWLLLLDELNSAPRSVQAAAYKLVLDRMVGQAKLHEKVLTGSAGNLVTDRAIVNQMSTAMQSRLIHIEMEFSFKEFMDHAMGARFDPRILAFLNFRSELAHNFDPDHTDRTFPCPRTWEFASRLIAGVPSDKVNRTLIAGAVGEGAAVEVSTFLEVYASLPSYAMICADAANAPIPQNPGPLYAVLMMLVDQFTKASFKDVLPYVTRLSPELQVVYCRGVKQREPNVASLPAFLGLLKSLTRFLLDDDLDSLQAA